MTKLTLFRSLLAAGCSVALICSAGCSSSQPVSTADDGQPLEVWSRSGPEAAKTYQAVLDAFTQKTGIKVDYLATVEFETQLQARAAAKDLPDVMIYDQASMAGYAEKGMLLPVKRDAIAGADQLSDASWESVQTADGSHYAVPFSQHAQITFIRKDWRERLGIASPKTHDELLDLATAFATGDPDGNGVNGDTYGMTIPGTTDRGFFTWWASSYLWQRGGSIVSGGDGKYAVEVDSPGTVKAVSWLKELFCTPNMVQPGALTNASATPFFAEGKSGIYQTGPYAFVNFDKSPGKDKYEVIAAPKGPGGGTTLTERTSIYFGASTNKPDKQQALAEFLISPEAQKIGMTAPGQPVVRIPVNESVDAAAVYGDQRWTVVQDQLADSKLLPSDIDFTVIRQDVAETLNSMFGQCSSDVQAELSSLADRITEDLESRKALR
ncbi:extracellular solute-binding protein [Arthrobacter sp. BE255]|uniref:ABC transporter substrate-binding protein n=1 Tax=Arthrobacter sp. BE255 TaxID=2817721 RepID=UPI002864FE00|nr:extracellular solute-binding protein [Arthrobacter sp. BE255]MDR7158473.1 multiple sugar transport system substrate-binding protein [Arthrobacter sp. BE255]